MTDKPVKDVSLAVRILCIADTKWRASSKLRV